MDDKTIKELHFALLFGGIIIYLYSLAIENIIILTGSIVPMFMGYIPLELSILKKEM